MSQRLVNARRKLGLTQKQLATILGINSATLYYWENGHIAPAQKALRRLDDLLQSGKVTPL